MKKAWMFFAVALCFVMVVSAGAEGMVIETVEETETGLAVSGTVPQCEAMYLIGVRYGNSGQLEKAVSKKIPQTTGETYDTVLEGLSVGDSIFAWNEKMQPLCAKTTVEGPLGDGVIHLLGTEIDATGVSGVSVENTIITITEPGDYYIEGTLTDGQIVVSDALAKKDEVNITLMGVNVTSSDSAPFNASNGVIGITLAEGTENTFTDTAKYTNYVAEPKGCFYAKRDMDIGGSGTLIVNGNVKNGLVCGADLKIKKGANITVTAKNNAIKGDNGVTFTDKTGTVTVNAGGDGIKSDAVDGDTGLLEEDKGYVEIEGGTFSIVAEGDGIQADNYCTVSGGALEIISGTEGIKANEVNVPASLDDVALTDEDGNPVYINGKVEITGGNITIIAGEDGVKATESVTISGVDTIVNIDATAVDSTDNSGYDGIQAGETTETVSEDGLTVNETVEVAGAIDISGGTISIEASDDCIISNGSVAISGGTVSGNATCDFIKAFELVEITGGILDIVCTNDGIQSGKALTEVSDGTTITKSNYTTGNVKISDGEFTILANGGSSTNLSDDDESCKGIKANTELEISGGTFNISSADDCIHSNYNVTITGGTFNLATADDGVHADYILTLGTEGGADDDFNIDISTSYEGIEGSVINILSGTQYIYATDDGINAAGDYSEDGSLAGSNDTSSGSTGSNGSTSRPPGSNFGGGTGSMGPNQGSDDTSDYGMMYIKGGRCFVEAYGDGIDSNGSISMTGGIVIENGPTGGGNGVFDIGDSNDCYFKITGGTLIGAGSSDMAVTPTVSGQGSVKVSNGSGNAGTPVQITTADDIFIFVPKVNWSYLFATSPEMSSGETYSATTVSSYSGAEIFGKTVNGTFYGIAEKE